MSTFEKTNNVESPEELLEDIKIEEENRKEEELSESFIIELEKKMKDQIIKDEEEAHSKGFSVRKDKQYYFNGNLVVREKRLVCYRHGEKYERQRKSINLMWIVEKFFKNISKNASLELDDYLEKLHSTSSPNISAENGKKNIEDKVLDSLHVRDPDVRKECIPRHWEKPQKGKNTQSTREKTKKSQKPVAPPVKKLFEDNVYIPQQATSPLLEANLQLSKLKIDIDGGRNFWLKMASDHVTVKSG
ncbi:hypothetical protein RND71_012911 [Anisodus tanguticus]|uniref:Uncharacterized protein n=1 Tax=Anisodus tanguticus TaxID=243964 RepID=A0AAE1SE85_9SOLA|nr:hypothetical protein RND71_012911 [Anisodus tanguticus]